MLESVFAVHPTILQRFKILEDKGRLGHAYLFLGPHSVGKTETALAIAKMLNCEAVPPAAGCSLCPACRKIDSGNHPDVQVLDAGEEESIKIAPVREIIQRLQLRPYEARKKVVIIKDIERMTTESSNAFLKTLEEPPKDTVLLLTTSAPELILSTIKSRCQHVYLFSAARPKVAAALRDEFSFDKESAHFLAFFTEGCIGRAKQLGDKKFFLRKNEIINEIVQAKNNDTYLKELLADKAKTREALEILLSWFRDLIFAKMQVAPDLLINVDRVQDLRALECSYTFTQLAQIVAGIEQALKLLDENLNVKISFYLLMEKIWVRA